MLGEGIELSLPEALVAGNPTGSALQRSCSEPATMDPTVLLPYEQPRTLEGPEVLGNGREGHVEGLRQTRHGRLSVRQSLQDRSTGRIGQSGKGHVQGRGIVNHMVNNLARPGTPVKRKIRVTPRWR